MIDAEDQPGPRVALDKAATRRVTRAPTPPSGYVGSGSDYAAQPAPSPETDLEFLARRRFPNFRALMAPEKGANALANLGRPATPQERALFADWVRLHSALPPAELEAIVAEELTKFDTEKDQKQFFSRPAANAEFAHWSRMAHWSLDEAIALSLGKNPEVVNWQRVGPLARPMSAAKLERSALVRLGCPIDDIDPRLKTYDRASAFARDYASRREVAIRAVVWKQLYDPVLPALFIRWAERNEYSFPTALRNLIAARVPIRDWKDLNDQQAEMIEALNGSLAAMTARCGEAEQGLRSLEEKRLELQAAASSASECAAHANADLEAMAAQLASVAAERDALRTDIERACHEDGSQWPWGTHETELLQHLAAAAHEWWSTYDAGQPNTAPTNDDVVAWLVERKLQSGKKIGTRVAEIMAQLLRPPALPSGPRR